MCVNANRVGFIGRALVGVGVALAGASSHAADWPGSADGGTPLQEAVRSGRVRVTVTALGGSSGDTILLTLTRAVPERLHLTVPPGTVFASTSRNVQNMVAASVKGELVGEDMYRPTSDIRLVDSSEHTYVVEAYCMDFHKATPEPRSTFRLRSCDASAAQVIEAGEELSASIPAIQSALWLRQGVTLGEVSQRFPVSNDDLREACNVLHHVRTARQRSSRR